MFRCTRRNKLNIAFAMLSVGLVQGCDNANDIHDEPRPSTAHELPVAMVSGVVITQQRLLAEAYSKGIALSEVNLKKLLGTMIDKQAATQKVETLGLDKDPEFVTKYQQLAYNSLQRQFEADSEDLLDISQTEIAAFYRNNQEKFRKPAKAQLAIIELAPLYGSDPSLLNSKAQSIWDELHQVDVDIRPQLFIKLAEKHSTHRASRYRGGSIGYISELQDQQWPKELINLGLTLPVGEFSELSADNKIYIIHVKDRLPETIATLEEATPRIKRILGAQKYQDLQDHISRKIRDGLVIETNSENLKSLATVTKQDDSRGFSTPPLD